MSFSINVNPSAQSAVRTLSEHQRALTEINRRISTGRAVDGAKDNGSIYTIAQNMRGRIGTTQVIKEGLLRGVSAIDVALAASEAVVDILLEVKEKLVAFSGYPAGDPARQTLRTEVETLMGMIDQVVNNASFQGLNLLSGTKGSSYGSGQTPSIPKADFVFLIDRTGSMATKIADTKNSIGLFSQQLVAAGIDARFGLMMYADAGLTKIPLGGADFTSDPVDLQTGLDSITLGGAVESSLDAMILASTAYSYRADATKQIVNVTDDTLQTSSGKTPSDVVNALQAQNISAQMIGINTVADHQIADQTGGSIFDVDNPQYDEILDAIATSAVDNSQTATAVGDQLTILLDEDGPSTLKIGHRPMSLQSLNISSINFDIPIDAVGHVERALNKVLEGAAHLGTDARMLDIHLKLLDAREDALSRGLGNLVDADLAVEAAKLAATQIKQQLALQSLTIANRQPELFLRLFDPDR